MRDNIDFKNTNIRELFRKFLIPTVLGMIFSAVFVITDGIFVGKGIGSDALAAVNLVAPLYMLSTGIGLMFGMGGSVVASINLSRGKIKVANINMTQAVVVPALLMVACTGLILTFRESIIDSLGTPAGLREMVGEYLFYFTLFFTFNTLFNLLIFFIRLDGSPNFAMTCDIIAAVTNIVLDYLFIFVFGWGLMGAAVATGIGIVIATILMLARVAYRPKTIRFERLKLSRKSLLLTARNIGYMAKVGFSALLSDISISCMMIVGNYVFIRYTGTDGVAAFSTVCYFFPIIFMVYSAIVQSAQPIVSFNYGIGDRKRVRQATMLALRTALLCGIVFFIGTALFRHQIVSLFLDRETPAYEIAVGGIPYFAAGYIFFGINVVAIGYYQSIERAQRAIGLTVMRGIVLMTLCFLLLPSLLQIKGIWLAVPLAELLGTVLIGLLFIRRKKLPLPSVR